MVFGNKFVLFVEYSVERVYANDKYFGSFRQRATDVNEDTIISAFFE